MSRSQLSPLRDPAAALLELGCGEGELVSNRTTDVPRGLMTLPLQSSSQSVEGCAALRLHAFIMQLSRLNL